MSKVNTVRGEIDIQRLPVNSEEHRFHDWVIKYRKSHILHSICTTTEKCADETQTKCLLCAYTKALELPHLPEMVFPNNVLTLIHNSGAQIEFNALDALKNVCNGKKFIKVACSEAWQETRSPAHLGEKIKPFDWTFSNEYKGTLSGSFKIVDTDERIDIERLKQQEKILFYQDLMLYEDELHDNGISSCTIKIRVMPSCYFILLRYFLRVDNVMVRVNDTRYFHDFTTDYVLREFTNKECAFKDINLPLTTFGDPNLLSPHMPLRSSSFEKITFERQEVTSSSEDSSNVPESPSTSTSASEADAISNSQ